MKITKAFIGGAAAIVAAGASIFGLAGSASAAPANGAYLYASQAHPIYWGCENPSTGGLVGGRFYEFAGQTAIAPENRYPGCDSWAKITVWDSHSIPESTRTSVNGLAIDGAPGDSGSGGSGGWGWDSTANKPVTVLKVGTNAGLTVTALQSNPVTDASITVSWNPDDFDYVGNGDSSAACGDDTAGQGAGVETCTYTDFAHSAKGDTFTFTPKQATSGAVVTASVEANGKTATATFPVQINVVGTN